MKTPFIIRLAVALFVLFTVQRVSAQDVPKRDTLPTVVITSTSLVAKEVTDAFKSRFKDAVDPKWYQMNKNYLVKFIQKDQKNNALYNQKGSLIYHISYGDKKNVPDNIMNLVKLEYPNYDVKTAIHVNQSNRSIWVVNLEGKDLVLARVEDGIIQEVERLKDASAKMNR